MKKYKKIWVGLFSALAMFMICALAIPAHKALAAAPDFSNATYQKVSDSEIDVTLPGAGTPIQFNDSNPGDSNKNYKPTIATWGDVKFCNGTEYEASGGTNNPKKGITFNTATSAYSIDVDFDDGSGCPPPIKPGVNNYSADLGALIGPETVTFNGTTYYPLGPRPTAFYGNSTDAQKCYGGSIVILNSLAGGTQSGTLYNLSSSPLGRSLTTIAPGLSNPANCTLADLGQPISVNSAGAAAAITPGPTTASSTSCADNAGSFGLAWLFCPLLIAAQDGTDFLLNQFESLLSFTIPQPIPANSGMTQVKQSWAIFRTLASAMLVIVLLIVVISQAIGGTFLDAYSVRKMLPKIVIAVIAMQLSWSLIVYVVLLVDHLGKGISDLMYFPFHGSNQMSLGALLDHAKIGTGQQAAINWVAIMGGLVLGTAALPAVLMFLFVAAIGLLVGFITLILRKMIIILTLIFVPVALVLWILPSNGTQKLWKLWLDNFSKALLMFPLVVILVAGGRILAYVAGTQSQTEFLNMLIIFVGFFGPLFIIPKAFKWGGSAMQLTGNALTRAAKPVGEKGGTAVKNWGQRTVTDRFAKKYTPADKWFKRTGYSIAGGRLIPTRYQKAILEQRGDKWNEERKAEALANVNRIADTARARGIKGYKLDDDGNIVERNLEDVAAYKQAMLDVAINGSEREQEMAITRLAQTSSWPEIQGNYAKDKDGNYKRATDSENWNKTFINNEQLYPQVQGKRYDQVPHIRSQTYSVNQLQELGYARQGDGSYRRAADGAVVQAGARLSPGDRIAVAAKDYMSAQDFASQSQGFWDEALRVKSPVIAGILRRRLEEVADTGSYGIQVLGAMKGGEQGQRVQQVLGLAGGDLDALIVRAQQVAVSGQRPVQPPNAAAGPAPPQEGGEAETEVDIPHDENPPGPENAP